MVDNWKIIETDPLSAEAIMAMDAKLLASLLPGSAPILHLYHWKEPSVTYGHFIKPEYFLKLDALKENGLTIARRPTGGGVIFHLRDLAFSLLVPSTHSLFSLNTFENYAIINQWLIQVLQNANAATLSMQLFQSDDQDRCEKPSFCMVKPTCYDVVIKGKKVAGAAIRKTRQGFLFQGSLSLSPTPQEILNLVLKEPNAIIDAINAQSFYLMGLKELSLSQLDHGRKELREKLKSHFSSLYLKKSNF